MKKNYRRKAVNYVICASNSTSSLEIVIHITKKKMKMESCYGNMWR
jgi:hypothetical protein